MFARWRRGWSLTSLQRGRAGALLVALACGIGSGVVSAVEEDGKPLTITFAGGSAQGSFSALGEGLGEMVRREYPGSSYTYEPGSLVGALARIANGDIPVGLAGNAEMTAALDGDPPYKRKYTNEEFKVVARVGDNMFAYVIARKDYVERHGIRDLSDIAAKRLPIRVSMGQLGNLSVFSQATEVFAFHQMPQTQIEHWGGKVFFFPARASIDLMKDDRVDATFTAGFHPDSRLVELERATPILMLPLGAGAIAKIVDKFDAEVGAIPAGTYDFLGADYPTTTFAIYVLAGKGASDLQTYKIAKAIYRHFDYLKSLHPVFADYRTDMLPKAGRNMLHPGAAQFYREAGLLDP